MPTIFPQEGRETDLSVSQHARRTGGIKYPFAITYFLCQNLCGMK